MNRATLKIGGMTCGMCEAHVCDVLRRAIPCAKKVSACRKSGEATFVYEGTLDEEALKKVAGGYNICENYGKACPSYINVG